MQVFNNAKSQPPSSGCCKGNPNWHRASRDPLVMTSANTPKSEQLITPKIDIDLGKTDWKSQEVKGTNLSSFFNNLILDKSPGYSYPSNLEELEDRVQESKRFLLSKSPLPPMTSFLNKESAAGETPFQDLMSPKRTDLQLYRTTVGLWAHHFEESGLKEYISNYESESEEILSHQNVPDFTLNGLNNDIMSDVQSVVDKNIHKDFTEVAPLPDLHVEEFEGPNLFEEFVPKKGVHCKGENKEKSWCKKATKKQQRAKPVIKKRIKTGENTEVWLISGDDLGFDNLLVPKSHKGLGDQKVAKVPSKNGSKNYQNDVVLSTTKNSQSQKFSIVSGSNRNSRNLQKDIETVKTRKSSRLMKKKANLEECKGCTCKRSKCIKLYCECFLSKGFCSPACSWVDCENMEENQEEILKIRQKILARNPRAFDKKILRGEATEQPGIGEKVSSTPGPNVRHIKGWTCKKSQCSNNYWECHQHGVKCTELCSCTDWHNCV